jgi:MFS family permease
MASTRRASPRYGVYGVFVVIGASLVTFTLAALVIPVTAARLGAPGTVIGMFVALPGLAGVVADAPAAAAADAYGRRRLIAFGGGTAVIAGLIGMLDGYVSLAAASLLLGVSQSLSFGPALSFSTQAVDRDRQPRLQGANGATQSVAALVGGVLGSALSGDRQLAFSFLAGLGLVTLVATTVLPSGGGAGREALGRIRLVSGSYGRALRLFLTQPAVQFATLTGVLFTILWVIIGGSFVPLYLLTELGYSSDETAIVLGARGLLSAAGGLAFVFVLRWVGLGVACAGPLAAALVMTAALGVLPPGATVPVLIVASGLAMGFAVPSTNLALAWGTREADRTMGVATVTLTTRIAALLIPIALGITLEFASIGASFLLAAVLGAGVLGALVARVVAGSYAEIAQGDGMD